LQNEEFDRSKEIVGPKSFTSRKQAGKSNLIFFRVIAASHGARAAGSVPVSPRVGMSKTQYCSRAA